jgi:hypothetical protein
MSLPINVARVPKNNTSKKNIKLIRLVDKYPVLSEKKDRVR